MKNTVKNSIVKLNNESHWNMVYNSKNREKIWME